MDIRLRSGRQRRRSSRQNWFQDWTLLVIAPSVSIFISILNALGLMQTLEWAAFDHFIRCRPVESLDARIVVVTIDDEDITSLAKWPVSDETLAKVLLNLKAQKPKAIGLDLYRDLPIEPGHQALVDVFKSTPNLIGVQRFFGAQKVPPPPVLAQLNQVADADIPEDPDKRVRRALLTGKELGQVYMGLGLAVALKYLNGQGITPVAVNGSPDVYQLGKTRFEPFRGSDGGYVRADDRGYQMLLNFRGAASAFQRVSFRDVLQNRLPGDLVKDRVVLIGSTAESVKDLFLTPYNEERLGHIDWTPGVFVHANIASQIMSAALDNRPLLRGLPKSLKGIWTLTWAVIGVLVGWKILNATWLKKQLAYGVAVLGAFLASGSLITVSYLLFLASWWLPVAAPIFALNGAILICFAYHSYKLQQLAYFDGLTQVANRRYFDLYLAEQAQKKGDLSLILCDVDYFKFYNDTYGHQAGDQCLQKIAMAICSATRRADFVTRYGGEEFAVILPHADIDGAAAVAEHILKQVRMLAIPHQSSKVAEHVTLSCGVATVKINDQRLREADWSGVNLIAQADKALYTSKHNGRDRFTLMGIEPGDS